MQPAAPAANAKQAAGEPQSAWVKLCEKAQYQKVGADGKPHEQVWTVAGQAGGGTVDAAVQREIVEPLGIDAMGIGWSADRRDQRADLIVASSPTARFENGTARAANVKALQPTIDAFVVPRFTEFIRSDAVYTEELPALN